MRCALCEERSDPVDVRGANLQDRVTAVMFGVSVIEDYAQVCAGFDTFHVMASICFPHLVWFNGQIFG